MNKITVDNFEETPEMQAEALTQARREIGPTNVPEINLAKEEVVSIGLLNNPDGTTTEAEHTHAVVTFLSPAFGQQLAADGTPGFKIYGAYCSNEAALAAAAQIRDYHTELYGKPIFGIIVVEIGKITPFPMTREQLNKVMTNKEASDEALNEMISNYRTEQKKAQILFDKRKDTLVKSAKEFTALERARQLREAAVAAESSSPETERAPSEVETSSSSTTTVASAGAGL
jgi:hypothetical protein